MLVYHIKFIINFISNSLIKLIKSNICIYLIFSTILFFNSIIKASSNLESCLVSKPAKLEFTDGKIQYSNYLKYTMKVHLSKVDSSKLMYNKKVDNVVLALEPFLNGEFIGKYFFNKSKNMFKFSLLGYYSSIPSLGNIKIVDFILKNGYMYIVYPEFENVTSFIRNIYYQRVKYKVIKIKINFKTEPHLKSNKNILLSSILYRINSILSFNKIELIHNRRYYHYKVARNYSLLNPEFTNNYYYIKYNDSNHFSIKYLIGKLFNNNNNKYDIYTKDICNTYNNTNLLLNKLKNNTEEVMIPNSNNDNLLSDLLKFNIKKDLSKNLMSKYLKFMNISDYVNNFKVKLVVETDSIKINSFSIDEFNIPK